MFGPPKSGSIPPIGSSGTPIFSGRDARHSDLPGGGAQRRGRSLEMVEISLFWVNLGHLFVLDKGRRVVDPIFFGRRLAAPPRCDPLRFHGTHTSVCNFSTLVYRWWARPWPKSIIETSTHIFLYVWMMWLTEKWAESFQIRIKYQILNRDAFLTLALIYCFDLYGVVYGCILGYIYPFYF